MRSCPFVFTGNAPRMGWRVQLNDTNCTEQRGCDKGFSYLVASYYDSDLSGLFLSVALMILDRLHMKKHSSSLQYKQIIYCDSTLLEEDDVYSSPYMYTTIDGERHEILLVGYDYYEKSWRCEYEYAIKDNTGQFYGFHNCFIEKYKADSIVDIWLNKN